jgi:hypothetical protein
MPAADEDTIELKGGELDERRPLLRRSFNFYYQFTLPRRIEVKVEDHKSYEKLEFGKEGGELFPVFASTPMDLRDFGLGVAMYFQTLQILCATCFLCGLFMIQAITFYKSEKYSAGQPEVKGMLKGSAICTEKHWVCTNGNCTETRIANMCHMGEMQAKLDLSMSIFLFVGLGMLAYLQNKVSADLDESVQTAQDYAIVVDDPGPDDMNPDEWQEFFQQFGHVTFVTIALDNGELLKLLVEKRALQNEINMENPADIDERRQEKPKSWHNTRDIIIKIGIFGIPNIPKIEKKLEKVNAAIAEEVAKANYKAFKVFVIFETEQAQRRCLMALTRGSIAAAFDWKTGMEESHLWKGDNVLDVKEAPEPSEVRWEDMHVTFNLRARQQGYTFGIAIGFIIVSVVMAKQIQMGLGPPVAALWITITNISIPIYLRHLTFKVEDHVSMNSQQMSLYFKLAFFRWCNSAIVIWVITPFENTLNLKTMTQVQAVLMADAVTTPLVRALNPMDAIQKLFISKFAWTQEKMNTYFLGTPWYPAERYADMTKTFFLSLFWNALYPQGLFITALAYAICYTLDKYCLLRSWQTPAQLDDDLTKKSRAYLAFALYAHVVMTMIFYSGWPFDNTCPKIPHKHLSREVFKVAQSALNVTSDYVYEECDQNPAAHIGTLLAGGSTEQSYMYGHQKRALHLYATVVMFMTVVLIGVFFGKTIVESVLGLFYGSYSAETTAQKKPFSKEKNIQAYIPEMRHPKLTYPLVATSLEAIDSNYCSFEDDGREGLYEAQCINSKADFPDLDPVTREKLFSKAKYYKAPDDYTDAGGDDEEGMAPDKQWKLPKGPKYKKVNQDESSA